jgi:hypothetical protein
MPIVGTNDIIKRGVISGGIERFQYSVYHNIDGVVPVYINKADKLHGCETTIDRAVEEVRPDIIFTNHMNAKLSKNLDRYGIKQVHVHHEPIERNNHILKTCENLLRTADNGADIYFVSELQWEFYDHHCKRLLGRSLGNICGFINPAYSDSSSGPRDIRWNVGTIGRCIPSKDPFWVHRKFKNTDLTTLVMTSRQDTYKSTAIPEYIRRNSAWSDRATTTWGGVHQDNMRMLSECGSFVSTWALESWGITALEALSNGVPTILLCDGSGRHASESIAADSNHIIKLKKSTPVTELVGVIRDLNSMSRSDREAISLATMAKHSRKAWIDRLNVVFHSAIGRHMPFKNELFSFE